MHKYVYRGYSWVALVVSALAVIACCWMYPSLPETVPLHWNWRGEVDKMGAKGFLFVAVIVPLIINVLLHVLPRLDRDQAAYEKHKKAYSVFVLTLSLFFAVIMGMILLAASGVAVRLAMVLGLAIGIMLLVIGNYARQVRPNALFGIRAPWVRKSETTWRTTHRLGSVLFALVGLWMLSGGVLDSWWMLWIGMALLLVVTGVLLVYSYYLSKRDM